MTSGRQIYRALKGEKLSRDQFLGVFAADKLPSVIDAKPAGLVVNTDNASDPGEHWVAMYFPADGPAEFFDSYGSESEAYNQFAHYLSSNAPSVVRSYKCLQNPLTSACGQYCIFFMIHRCHGASLQDIIRFFDKRSDTFVNDSFVTAWVNKRCRMRTDVVEADNFIDQISTAFRL